MYFTNHWYATSDAGIADMRRTSAGPDNPGSGLGGAISLQVEFEAEALTSCDKRYQRILRLPEIRVRCRRQEDREEYSAGNEHQSRCTEIGVLARTQQDRGKMPEILFGCIDKAREKLAPKQLAQTTAGLPAPSATSSPEPSPRPDAPQNKQEPAL